MRWRFRRGRPVQQQWPYQNRASRRGDARDHRVLTPADKLVLGQPAMEMRSGEDLQRSVPIGGVVNVEPDRYHLLEHVDGWVNMCDALLDRPAGKAGHIRSSQDGDGYVLMPPDRPVCAGFLIKQDRPVEKRFTGEKLFRQFKDTIRQKQFADSRSSRQHIPDVRAVALECVKCRADFLDGINRKNILDDQETVVSELLMLLPIDTHRQR